MADFGRGTGTVPGPHWVSAADAADEAGVSPAIVRAWAQRGVIAAQKGRGPTGERTMVRLEEVLAYARGEDPPDDAGAEHEKLSQVTDLSPVLKSIPELINQLTSATDRAARAETKVEFLSGQIVDLRSRLADAEAALRKNGASVPASQVAPESQQTFFEPRAHAPEPAETTPEAETEPHVNAPYVGTATRYESPSEAHSTETTSARSEGIQWDRFSYGSEPEPAPAIEEHPAPAQEEVPDEPEIDTTPEWRGTGWSRGEVKPTQQAHDRTSEQLDDAWSLEDDHSDDRPKRRWFRKSKERWP